MNQIMFCNSDIARDYENLYHVVDPNQPSPEMETMIGRLTGHLQSPDILTAASTDPALAALHTQTTNHLKHVSFRFETEEGSEDYPHKQAIKDRFPHQPAVGTIAKTVECLQAFMVRDRDDLTEVHPYREVMQEELERYKTEQQEVVRSICAEPLEAYNSFTKRLNEQGPDASFPEFSSTAHFLKARLEGGNDVQSQCGAKPHMELLRGLTLDKLNAVLEDDILPYRQTILAIERAVEFFDVLKRAENPDTVPELYHSDRYEYYFHYLLAEPEHVLFPTISGLGATDLLKVRGVPLGFVGVNTELERVDGFVQTPYEFFHHDVNHSRRMYQFFTETAHKNDIDTASFAAASDYFVHDKLIPAIVPNELDTPEMAQRKIALKMLMFEILHEDALAAHPQVMTDAILRPELHRTPFERIEDDKVIYFMEPGATTLAYVFRKLAHTFYDTPDKRSNALGSKGTRSRLAIAQAGTDLYRLVSGDGVTSDDELIKQIEQLVATDEGFPDAFFHEVAEDVEARAEAEGRDFTFIISHPQSAELAIAGIRKLGKRVHSLFGYSDLGYQDQEGLLQAVETDLSSLNPNEVAIAIGATPGGIGAAYEVAKAKGFDTIGIVSSKSLVHGGNYSAAVDQIFVVKDTEWGGYVPGSDEVTPTTKVFIDASDSIAAYGGGKITAVTLAEAVRRAKQVTFTPSKTAQPNGSGSEGPAFHAWQTLQQASI